MKVGDMVRLRTDSDPNGRPLVNKRVTLYSDSLESNTRPFRENGMMMGLIANQMIKEDVGVVLCDWIDERGERILKIHTNSGKTGWAYEHKLEVISE